MTTLISRCAPQLALALLAGCAQVPPPPPPPAPEPLVVAQVGYGPAARYRVCPQSICGTPTPKTLPEAPRNLAVVAATAASSARTDPPLASAPPVAPVVQAVKLQTHSLSIGFATNSSELSTAAKAQLDRLAPLMAGAREISIRGRTDASGDAALNERLAVRRARAVYDHLRQHASANPGLFKISAQGACCFNEPNHGPAGRSANRRAEVDVVYPIPQPVVGRF